MSVENALDRIAAMGGVDGYVIIDNKGVILRQSKSLSLTQATQYATEVSKLTEKARHVVRDLDPKNELDFFRLRCKEKEILAAPGPQGSYLVIVVQSWLHNVQDDNLGAPAPGAGAASAEGK